LLIAPIHISTHKAISEIRETNNHPVIGECEDINDYVIKHNRGKFPANKLANELIASYFLQLWKIPTPEVRFVTVRQEDIWEKVSNFCQPGYFNIPCFGTHYYEHGMEFNHFLEQIRHYEKQRFFNLKDTLKIGFFDIWMANEDRTTNNPNLLIVPKEHGYEITAIDHESCFNTNTLEGGIYQIGITDSILAHPAIVQLCGSYMRNTGDLEQIIEEVYLCTANCEQELERILSFIPDQWQVDKANYENLLRSQLFSKEWIEASTTNFLSILQQINNP